MLEPLSSVVDTALVGHYDTKSLAALAVGSTMMGAFTWMFNFLIHAPVQSISQAVGERDYLKIHSLTKLALTISFALSIFLLILILPFKDSLYSFMEVGGKVREACDDYFTVRVLGHFGVLFYTVILSVLRGLAKVGLAFKLVGFSTLLNIVLSYLSLYQLDLGLQGVALSTVVSNFAGFLIGFFIYLRINKIEQSFFSVNLNLGLIKEFSSKSLNIFGRSFVLTSCFFLSTKAASSIGQVELAAHQIILQIWLFVSFFTDGLATSGSIVGGRFFNKNNKKLSLIFKKLLVMSFQLGVVFTLSLYLFNSLILMLFTTDAVVISKINDVWPLIVIAQAPLAIAYVYDGLIFGINRFSYLRKHMMIGFIVTFIPLLYYSFKKESLLIVWSALFAIGLYRLVSNYFCIRNEFKEI